jgi:hypothetical protein
MKEVECIKYIFHSHSHTGVPVCDWDIVFFPASVFDSRSKPKADGYTISRFSQRIFNKYPDNPILPFKCCWVGEKMIPINNLQN